MPGRTQNGYRRPPAPGRWPGQGASSAARGRGLGLRRVSPGPPPPRPRALAAQPAQAPQPPGAAEPTVRLELQDGRTHGPGKERGPPSPAGRSSSFQKDEHAAQETVPTRTCPKQKSTAVPRRFGLPNSVPACTRGLTRPRPFCHFLPTARLQATGAGSLPRRHRGPVPTSQQKPHLNSLESFSPQ